jgi:hypothetical protein
MGPISFACMGMDVNITHWMTCNVCGVSVVLRWQVCGDRGPTPVHQRRVGRVGGVDVVQQDLWCRHLALRATLQPSAVSTDHLTHFLPSSL